MTKKRKTRHHTVPRLHLRGFASSDKMLVQLDLSTGIRRDVGVGDAAVIRDFYTVRLPDGTRTDAWEQWLSEVEDKVAPALRRAIEAPRFRLDDYDRELLARWIALQALRGPDNRRHQAELASFTVRAQVAMGGLAYLQHAMSHGLGRPVLVDEAAQVWDDITSPEGPVIEVSGDEHLVILTSLYERAAEAVYARSWGRVRFGRHRLALSDAPVSLIPDYAGGYPSSGLLGARAITVALDRQNLLWLDLAGENGPTPDRELEPSTHLARLHNLAAVAGAERFVYFNPEDAPIPSETVLPRPQPKRIQVSDGPDFVNRDRPLADVLNQIAVHRADPSADSLIADYTWPIEGYRQRLE
ncbi:uncharacterized protein DUF4238 [Isoptericola jiangsuensis]|uniref:Uncharacterized protein DUF4238 n=1 Tax=Isoptericola jiangsuensis TaxID=548579 RepID=A0A2A9EZY8_9MICO|nr:DUF4238 domain-containing protein [Isoptericola jiangsuensis]PFG43785.1 uncharacterized protein DUF4238 [Isoptericola jiangsuensis]